MSVQTCTSCPPPGSRDRTGRAVVEVHGERKEWMSPPVSAQNLCELLLYLHSIPRYCKHCKLCKHCKHCIQKDKIHVNESHLEESLAMLSVSQEMKAVVVGLVCRSNMLLYVIK